MLPIYDGQVLARKGAVLVTINYRLGVLGYLAHPAFASEDSHESTGNYGLLGQVAALRWVQNNIANFGGDPTRVTIFGASAGGFAVGALLASPLASGLFHRAILQSGTGIPYGMLARRTGEERAVRWAAVVGVTGTDASAAATLRTMDARAVVDAGGAAENDVLLAIGRLGGPKEPAGARAVYAPVEDNWSLPFLLDQAVSRGVWNRVPVLVGSNANEGTFFVRQLPESMTVDAYLSVLGPSGFGDPSGELARAYPVSRNRSERNPDATTATRRRPQFRSARASARAAGHARRRKELLHSSCGRADCLRYGRHTRK
jgi:para-nitrobenzyl esterase